MAKHQNKQGGVKMIKKLVKALKEDKDYYRAWKDNIAMAFKDEYYRRKKLGHYLNLVDIHEIANTAADNFLKMICK